MLHSRILSSVKIPKQEMQYILPIVPSSCSRRTYCQPLNNNDDVIPDFINRNPRSMELLRIARKPQGYCLDAPTNNYYYRLIYDSSQRYMTAFVEHNTGRTVVSASTKEWAIRKHLYSAKDLSAAENIGRILAQRCLQSGIYEMHTDLKELGETSQRVKIFLEAMVEGGVKLEEAPQIREKETYPTVPKIPTFPWEVTEEEVDRLDKQFPPKIDKESE